MREPSGYLVWHLTRLGIPVAFGALGGIAMGVTDAIVVGQIAPHQLAWQELGWTFNGPALLGGIGLVLGVQVLAARAVGAGRLADAGVALRKGVGIAFVAGLLVAAVIWTGGAPLYEFVGVPPELALPASRVARVLSLSMPLQLGVFAATNFLQALELPTPATVAIWLANGVNLVLDLLLIPHLGAEGSAWATSITRALLFAALLLYIHTRRDLKPYLARGKSTITWRALLTIGTAAAMSAIADAAVFATMVVFAAHIGPAEVAAFGIAMGGLLSMIYMIGQGYATAGTVLASQAIGGGALHKAYRIGWYAIALTAAGSALCGIFCVIFAGEVARLFTMDREIAAALVGIMALLAVLLIPDGGQGTVDPILRAHGVNWFPTIARTSASLLIAPALGWWLLGEGWGLGGLVLALLLAVSAGYVLMLVRYVLVGRAASSR